MASSKAILIVARALCVGIAVLAASLVLSVAADAVVPGPAWELSSVAQPTNFSAEDTVKCFSSSYAICDRYLITLTNVGNGPTTEAVTIKDTLSPGLKPVRILSGNLATNLHFKGPGWSCAVGAATCAYSGQVTPGATLAVAVEVEVEATAPTGEVLNAVKVSGGGATPLATSEALTKPNTVEGSPATFGLSAFGFAVHDESGLMDTHAGAHPAGVTSTVNLGTIIEDRLSGARSYASVEPPKDLAVYLPLGFLGDPRAAGQCTETQLIGTGAETETECPPTSRVGNAVLFGESSVGSSLGPPGGGVSAVYNMVPDGGYPAQFGLKVLGKAVSLYASVVHTPSGYALRVAAAGIPRAINVEGAALTFYGDPNTADENPSASQAFFTNPDNCTAGPLMARVQADSWAEPGQWASQESVAYPRLTGCELLRFEPGIELRPEVTEAEEPAGTEIKIKVPQNEEKFPLLATPQLKGVTMTLPEGMTISPGAGDGLVGCAARGPDGIDLPTGGGTPTEVGEGEEIGVDGMSHLVPGHCPPASQIGTVEISTPVLESPLEGRLYVAQPRCGGPGQRACESADALNGNLFGLYLEAEGSGVVVKLAGSVSADPATGRLTARFTENPQLPFSEVTIHLKGGERAPLANPRGCGEAIAQADLAPWSSPVTPDAIALSRFEVGSAGTAECAATLPFAPTLAAGPVNVAAGHYSPLTLTIRRGDHTQDLSRLQVKLPVGMLGMLSKVSLCQEPQAREGTCGEASRIGTVSVAAGSGPHPLWVQGRVYLTGPYGGAPFGLANVVPATAGPFNLGNVVVRARIDADPHSSQITITTDALPQMLDGVPLRIQTLNAAVDREGFTFNPTNCARKQIAATVEAEQGASASLAAPFVAAECRSLPFKPRFAVATSSRSSKKNGASLDVKVTSAGLGQANIAKVLAQLPKQLPARLTTLQQACPEATFAANPATCPAGSDVGTAKAITPVLDEPVAGPAYLVSHGGAAFPDLVVILQGQGVRLDLIGNTSIKKGITTSSFASIPDAPVTSFELKLPEGPHSALTSNLPPAAKGNLCGSKLLMPTTLTGQNYAVIKQSTKIAVAGCPRKRPHKAGARRHSRHAASTRP